MKYSNTILMPCLDRRVAVSEPGARIGIHSLPFGLEYHLRQWRRTGHLAEYYLEITFPAGFDGFGCRSRISNQRASDANRIP